VKKPEAIKEMRKLVGTRYRHQGRSAKTGLDCVGLGLQYAKLLGLPLHDRKGYGRDPDGNLKQSICHVMGQPIAQGTGSGSVVQEGDAVMMEWTPGVPRHVGMITEIEGVLYFMHANSSPTVMKVVEHRLSDDWRKRIVSVWRPA
jgi:cell wall-associated NlpC family hydrolase